MYKEFLGFFVVENRAEEISTFFKNSNMCTLVTEQELVHPGKRTKHCTEVSAAWSHQGPNLCHFISKTLKMSLAAQPHFVLNTEMLEQGNKTCRAYVSIM